MQFPYAEPAWKRPVFRMRTDEWTIFFQSTSFISDVKSSIMRQNHGIRQTDIPFMNLNFYHHLRFPILYNSRQKSCHFIIIIKKRPVFRSFPHYFCFFPEYHTLRFFYRYFSFFSFSALLYPAINSESFSILSLFNSMEG